MNTLKAVAWTTLIVICIAALAIFTGILLNQIPQENRLNVLRKAEMVCLGAMVATLVYSVVSLELSKKDENKETNTVEKSQEN